jgi:hypothetical protein
VDTVEHAEMVEKELGAFIERCSRKGAVDPDEESELWRESVRRYNARRQESLGDEPSRLVRLLQAPSWRGRFVCTTFFRIPRLCNRTLT